MDERLPAGVDPSLREALLLLPDFGALDLSTLPMFRQLVDGPEIDDSVVDGVEIRRVEIPGPAGRVLVSYLYRPVGTKTILPVILNIHGGGFVLGTPRRENAWSMHAARTLHCAVLSIQYSLAPEAPFPSGADDCLAALEWIKRKSSNFGIDGARIAVRGVSAGGGLAAGLALRTRGSPELAISFLMLVYPMLDPHAAPPEHAGHCVWTRAANAFGWQSLLGETFSAPSPIAAPAFASDLAGYPPTFIAVGGIDLFVAEDIDFAGRLVADGVETELHMYPGAYHGFNLVASSPIAQRFEADCFAALARAFERID